MRTTLLLLALTACDSGTLTVPGGADDEVVDTEDLFDDTDAVDDTDTDGVSDTDPGGGDTDASGDTDTPLPPLADPGADGSLGWDRARGAITLGRGPFATRIELVVDRPAGAGPFPVIVFSHGFQLSPADYATYARHLATWGYVVVRPDLPGSLIAPETHVELADYLGAVLDWVEDRGDDPRSATGGVADATRIAVAGHSLGGKLSLLLAADDDRPMTAFLLDPVDSGNPILPNPTDYPSVTPERMADITIPIGLIGETTNATGGIGGVSCAPEDENFERYYEAATGTAFKAEAIGANHMSFLDDPECGLPCLACTPGSDDAETTRRIARTMLTAWMQVFVRGDDRYLSWLTGTDAQPWIDGGLVTVDSQSMPTP